MARKKKVATTPVATPERSATPPSKVPSSPEARLQKSVDEVVGIPPLDLSNSPAADSSGNKSWTSVVRTSRDELNLCEDIDANDASNGQYVKITMDDIQEEIDYWTASVICHILGANPPVQVFSNFVNKIWSELNVDKVAALGKGYYIVKFSSVDDRNGALEKGIPFFDKKPVILRQGSADFDVNKVNEVQVPVWVRIPGLPLKYWGRKTLPKIVSSIGKPLRLDRATAAKERLHFARILVEMDIQKPFPPVAKFENEYGQQAEAAVSYEWRPIQCTYCAMFGHAVDTCKKKENEHKRCDYCNVVGHTKEECKRKGKQPMHKPQEPGKKRQGDQGPLKQIPQTERQEKVDQDKGKEKTNVIRQKDPPPPDLANYPPLSING